MLLFFAPAAFAASAGVVLCLETNGQTSFERAVGEDCTSFDAQYANTLFFNAEIPNANSMATPQHCSECTDFVLSGSVYRTKASIAENTNSQPQKLFVDAQSQDIWTGLSVTLSLAAAPPPLRISPTLAQLRTVIIRV